MSNGIVNVDTQSVNEFIKALGSFTSETDQFTQNIEKLLTSLELEMMMPSEDRELDEEEENTLNQLTQSVQYAAEDLRETLKGLKAGDLTGSYKSVLMQMRQILEEYKRI